MSKQNKSAVASLNSEYICGSLITGVLDTLLVRLFIMYVYVLPDGSFPSIFNLTEVIYASISPWPMAICFEEFFARSFTYPFSFFPFQSQQKPLFRQSFDP